MGRWLDVARDGVSVGKHGSVAGRDMSPGESGKAWVGGRAWHVTG